MRVGSIGGLEDEARTAASILSQVEGRGNPFLVIERRHDDRRGPLVETLDLREIPGQGSIAPIMVIRATGPDKFE
jgi:hypothetical protein